MVFGGPSDPGSRKNDPWRPPGGPRASAARRVKEEKKAARNMLKLRNTLVWAIC